MTLLDEVHQLQQRYADAGRWERVVLDLAASLLEEIHYVRTGSFPEVVTRMKVEHYLDFPDCFELFHRRIKPKRWEMYEHLRASTTDPDNETARL